MGQDTFPEKKQTALYTGQRMHQHTCILALGPPSNQTSVLGANQIFPSPQVCQSTVHYSPWLPWKSLNKRNQRGMNQQMKT